MNIEDAYRVLGLEEGAGETERHEAFQSQRRKLEEKLAKAPTPGLAAKYRDSIARMEQAIEVIELAADGGDLPALRPDFGMPERSENMGGDPIPVDDGKKKPAKASSGGGHGKEIFVALLLVLLMCGGAAGWWYGVENPKREQVARLVAQGVEHEAAERWDEAGAVYVEALSLKASWKEAQEGELRVKAALERIAADEVRSLAERDREVQRLLAGARLLQSQEEWESALEGFEEVLELDDTHPEAGAARDNLKALLATARGSIVVKSEPGGATVRLSGRGEELSPANYVDLKLGRYDVALEKKGYDPVEQKVVVRKDDTVVVGPVRLNRSEGATLLKSEPEGMAYTLKQITSDVSGEREFEPRGGNTPGVEADLPTGEYEVVMTRAGWPDYRRRINVVRDNKEEVFWEFGQGDVAIASTPAGAEVFALDGEGQKRIGVTPMKVSALPVGEYTYVLRREGWPDARKTVEVSKEKVAQVNWDFAEGDVTLTSTPAGCRFEVYVEDAELDKMRAELKAVEDEYKIKGLSAERNGFLKNRIAELNTTIPARQAATNSSSHTGTTPGTVTGLPVGAYKVRMSREGWPDYVGETMVEKGAPAKVDWEFAQGTLEVTSDPAGAEVIIAGKAMGTTPLQMEVPTGTHHVTLKFGPFSRVSKTILVTKNATAAVPHHFIYGNLNLTSQPSGAEVWLMGEHAVKLGVTPLDNLKVPSGILSLEIRSDKKYAIETIQIQVDPNGHASKSVVLKERKVALYNSLNRVYHPVLHGIDNTSKITTNNSGTIKVESIGDGKIKIDISIFSNKKNYLGTTIKDTISGSGIFNISDFRHPQGDNFGIGVDIPVKGTKIYSEGGSMFERFELSQFTIWFYDGVISNNANGGATFRGMLESGFSERTYLEPGNDPSPIANSHINIKFL